MRHLSLALLLALILWAPLPFGSVSPGGVVLVVLLVALLAVLLAFDRQAEPQPELLVIFGALVGLGALGIFQASSLGARWFGFLGGRLSAEVGTLQGGAVRESLSLAPSLSRQAAVGWWAVALLFVVAAIVGRRKSSKPLLLAAGVLAAGVQALYGWRQWIVAPHQVLGRNVSGPARLRGTMVNADHLAVFFEIAMAICLAWGWWAWRRSRREPRFAYRLIWLLPPLLCWAGFAAALFGTGSRAALAAAVLGLIVQAALVFKRRGRYLAPLAALLIIAIAGAWLATRGSSLELGRQLSRPPYEVLKSSRFAVWMPAIDLWRASPWIGTGLGTFEEGFPRVQPPELRKERWGRAHNDPLELLVTGGVVGAGLFCLALGCLVRRLWRVYRGGARMSARAAALAALAALPVVALHEGVDFGLTIPANAVLMTVLLGVGAAGTTVREEGAAPMRSR